MINDDYRDIKALSKQESEDLSIQKHFSAAKDKITKNVEALKADTDVKPTPVQLNQMKDNNPRYANSITKSAVYKNWSDIQKGRQRESKVNPTKQIRQYELSQLAKLPVKTQQLCMEILMDTKRQSFDSFSVRKSSDIPLLEVEYIKSHPKFMELKSSLETPTISELFKQYTNTKIETISFPLNVCYIELLKERYNGNDDILKRQIKQQAIHLQEKIFSNLDRDIDIPVIFVESNRATSNKRSDMEKKVESILEKLNIDYKPEVKSTTPIGTSYYDFLIEGKGVIEADGTFHQFPRMNKDVHEFAFYSAKWIFQQGRARAKVDFLSKNDTPCLIINEKDFNENQVELAIQDFHDHPEKYTENNYYNRTNNQNFEEVILRNQE